METIASYFDERAETWDTIAEPPSLKHVMMAQLAGVAKGARVLDVGCGTGIMEQAYLTCEAGDVLAIDVSQKMLDIAQGKFCDEKTITFSCADVTELEGKDRFDVIVMYNMYPHVLKPKRLAEAVHRLLTPTGRFLVGHGMGRIALNAHHTHVPPEIRSELPPVEEAVKDWEDLFCIDMTCDNDLYYFFGGHKK